MELVREACVESIEEIDRAFYGKADRIELCSRLEAGGFTPEPDLLRYAVERGLEVAAMVRRTTEFTVTEPFDALFEQLVADIHLMMDNGAHALVFGYLSAPLMHPHLELLFKLIKETRRHAARQGATPPQLVFHMAFDEIPAALHKSVIPLLAELGFTRILTKGGPGKALDNLVHLQKLNTWACGKLIILCGGGVTKENYQEIAKVTGIREFHGRKLVGY